MNDDDLVGRLMDKAEIANRKALFSAFQAALIEIIDLQHGGHRGGNPYQRIEKALDRGAPIGSPEHLTELNRELAAEVTS